MRPDTDAVTFVDAALFMGMHSEDDAVRRAAKAFFIGRLAAGKAGRVVMSWEQVGRCDDLVWGYDRKTQDEYYPFMDVLHTDLAVERTGYEEADVRRAFTAPELDGLPAHERLLLAQVAHRGGVLHTASPGCCGRPACPSHRSSRPRRRRPSPAGTPAGSRRSPRTWRTSTGGRWC